MTVDSSVNRIDHAPDGIVTVFPYDFRIDDADDLVVYVDGAVVVGGYTVSGVGVNTGGDVTFDAAPSADIDSLTFIREVDATQLTAYPALSPFPASSHERALDKLTFLIQQVQEQLTRVLAAPVDYDPAVQLQIPDYAAGEVLIWDTLEQKLVTSTLALLGGFRPATDTEVFYGTPAPDAFINPEQFQKFDKIVPTIDELRLSPGAFNGDIRFLACRTAQGDGGHGTFLWSTADLSAEVAADPLNGIYVAPTSDPTGVSGAWVRQLGGFVTPEMFGAVGDLITDDTEPIKAAFNILKDGDKLKFTAPGYKFWPSSTFVVSTSCSVVMSVGTYLDVSGAGNSEVLSFSGSDGAWSLLQASVAKYATSITVTPELAATLNSGDLVRISTNAAYGGSGELRNAARAYYYKGEIAEVLSVSGSLVTLNYPLYDSYTDINTVVSKINTISVDLTNFSMRSGGSNSQIGLDIHYGRNVSINGGTISGTAYTGLSLYYCYGVNITGYSAYDFNGASNGTNYGLSIASSQNVVCRGMTVTGGRHAVAIGGQEPARNILITESTLGTEVPASGAIDCHGNCEFVTYSNNEITGGGSLASTNIQIVGNRFIGDGTGTSAIVFDTGDVSTSLLIDSIVFRDNEFISKAVTGASILIRFREDSQIGTIEIMGNIGLVAVKVAQHSATIGAATINRLSVRGNTFKDSTGLSVLGLSEAHLTVNNIVLNNNIMDLQNIPCQIVYADGENLMVSTNDITTDTLNAHGGIVEQTSSTFDHVQVKNNVIRNTQPSYYTTTLIANSTIEYSGNTAIGYQRNGSLSLTAPDILIDGNDFISVVGTPIITGRAFSRGSGRQRIAYGTAAPVSYTWAVGDRMINSAPAVGSPKSWVCTVAGTPGTWVSEGNL